MNASPTVILIALAFSVAAAYLLHWIDKKSPGYTNEPDRSEKWVRESNAIKLRELDRTCKLDWVSRNKHKWEKPNE